MSRHLLWVIGFMFFIVQGTLMEWLIPISWVTAGIYVTPLFTLIFVLFIGIFVHRHTALIYGIVFGFLHDVGSYGNMLGVYTFSMGVTGYLVGLLNRYNSHIFFINFSMIGMSLLLFELINYTSNRLFRIMDTPLIFAFTNFMLPTILFNLFFALLFYVPLRKIIDRLLSTSARIDD